MSTQPIKQFFLTVPMNPNIKFVDYSYDEKPEAKTVKSRFPAIPMLVNNVSPGDNIEICAIMTDDDNKFTEKTYVLFKEELEAISKEIGIELKIDHEVIVPHTETVEKQLKFYNELCRIYKQNAKIYYDLTYGSKITSIASFSTLVFAENARNCELAEIIYGKFAFGSSTEATLYDVRGLYDLSMLLHSSSMLPNTDLDKILTMFGGV